MSNEIKEIKIQINAEQGMELKMFENSKGQICVRYRDIDAEENVYLVKCPTRELAETYWTKYGGK